MTDSSNNWDHVGAASNAKPSSGKTRNRFLAIGGVLATFAVGVLVGRLVPHQGSNNVPIVPIDVTASDLNSTSAIDGDADVSRTGYGFQSLRSADAPRQASLNTDDKADFGYRRLVLETAELTPRACLQFNRNLVENGKVNYGDYIRLTPSVRPAISVNKSSLCIGGLSFDTDYRVELRAGLPAADGSKLAAGENVTIAFGDKPAFVGFAGDGVILPRLEADGLGVETVNVSEVKLTVRRVSDRGLFQKAITAGEANSEEDYPYIYGEDDGEEAGIIVWEGKVETKGDPNVTATTVFALGAALKSLKPGAYFLTAEDASTGTDSQRRKAQAWRWIMYTDIALTSYRSDDGLDVFVRSIATARPLVGVEMVLLARNNDVLARASTNADGRVNFAGPLLRGAGALDPRYLFAYGAQDDFAAQDLYRTPLDLSERDIGGRSVPSVTDGFVYLDRGIYRPGESVKISALLRDQRGNALDGRAVTLKVYRPNGTLAEERRIEKLSVGGLTEQFDVPASAARGIWRIAIDADGAGTAGSTSFSVEDFVPQRLEVKLTTDETTPIVAGEQRTLTINSRFLYGAPASFLPVEGEVRYRVDPNPFADQKGYQFGPVNNNISETFRKLPNQTTNADGEASMILTGDEAPAGNGTPLRADIVVGVVEPGGRIVRESARIPVRPDETYVGVRLKDNKNSVSQKEDAILEAIILGRDGAAQVGELEWRLVREDYWFDWYRDNGNWRWRREYRDVLVDEGRVKTKADKPAEISKRLDYGSYRLAVWTPGSNTKSEKSFYVGWRSYGAGVESPDQAALSVLDEKTVPGTRARLFLDPPYAGEAMIVVATDKIHRIQRVKVEPGGREIVIDTDPAWGNGFYVMATIVTPRDAVAQPIPRRAMGVAYVPFDMSERTLTVSMATDAVLRPRQKLNLPVTIKGAGPSAEIMLTVAAVDEGILRLTKFASPDPVAYFYGKKALGLNIYDDYGRILNANLGAATRFGGDQIGGEGLTVVPTKSVALFSGLVKVDANGQALVPIDVPDFNGELRLMAVAWTKEKLGQHAQPLTVRDEVPAEISLSRFLAPGDTATATLLIDNVDGAAGDYIAKIGGSGPVGLDRTETITLAQAEKKVQEFPFTVGSEGIGFVSLDVTGPDGFAVSRAYPIQVRSPWFPVSETTTITQKPGEAFALTEALLDGYVEGSGGLTLSYSRLKGIEPGALLDALYRYPYGCTEQLTSSSFPLLFVDRLGGEVGRGPERAVRPRVQAAINKMLDRQGTDGAIGLWQVGDGYGNAWLGPYVTDFLLRAREEGYAVPDHALDLAYSAVAKISEVNQYGNIGYQFRVSARENEDSSERLRLRSAAYAHYVLARAGRADLSDIRYFHDSLLSKVQSPLAMAHIGAALAQFGDKARADNAFRLALKAQGHVNSWDYYQTPLRDAAGIVALVSEAGFDHLLESATDLLTTKTKDPNDMHTQEKAFVLMAANALLKSAGPIAIAVDGKELAGLSPSPIFTPGTEQIAAGQRYENRSDAPLYLSVTRTGTSKTAPLAASNGVTLTKRVATREGEDANLATIRQNDRLVILLTGRADDKRNHPLIIADLLPAGFEIETLINPTDKSYSWLGKLTYTRVAEARDDRFVAAVDVDNGEAFRLAYLVRAITPGTYTMPGGVVEDMYRPGVFARTTHQSLTIAPASGG